VFFFFFGSLENHFFLQAVPRALRLIDPSTHRKQRTTQDSTMQDSAPRPVVAIPELVAPIAQYLTRRDISQWMMACKTFSRQLEPYF